MIRSSRLLAVLAAFCMAILAAASPGMAAYPERPLHILVPVAAGSGADVLARMIGAKLSEKWGQPVLVENKPGADGAIVYDQVARSAPDGYTLAWVLQSFTVLPSQKEVKLTYDTLKDFAPVSLLVKQSDIMVVNASSPINSVKELIALAKSKPGQLNYGSAGLTSPQRLEMEQLKRAAGIDMVNVSYQGGAAPLIAALLGGEVQVIFNPAQTVGEYVKAGKLRPLAITSDKRLPLMADVPTMAEATGLTGFEDGGSIHGLIAAARTPADIVRKIRDDIATVMSAPDIMRFTESQGVVTVMLTSEQFAEWIRTEILRKAELVKSLDLK